MFLLTVDVKNVVLVLLVRILRGHLLFDLVKVQFGLILHVLFVVCALLGDATGLEPLEVARPQGLVRQPVQDEDRLLAVALLQLARREVDRHAHLPQAVQDVRDGRVGVVELLRLLELLAGLPA